MLQAIVYESNTGTTKRYAEMLAEKTGLPLYAAAESGKKLARDTSVVFLSWVSGGSVVALDKAKNYFDIRAVGAVGLSIPSSEREAALLSHHELSVPVFCLRGGFDMAKLSGMKKFAMKMMARALKTQQMANQNSEDDQMLRDIENGCDYVSEDSLATLVEWIDMQQVM